MNLNLDIQANRKKASQNQEIQTNARKTNKKKQQKNNQKEFSTRSLPHTLVALWAPDHQGKCRKQTGRDERQEADGKERPARGGGRLEARGEMVLGFQVVLKGFLVKF